MTAAPAAEKKPRTTRQRLWRWFVVVSRTLLISYVGVIIVLLWLENSLVYHPVSASNWQKPPHPSVIDVELTTSDGVPLHAWFYPKEDAPGAVLYFPGNAGNLSWRGDTLAKLRKWLNTSAMIVDYPGYGKSGGRPSEA